MSTNIMSKRYRIKSDLLGYHNIKNSEMFNYHGELLGQLLDDLWNSYSEVQKKTAMAAFFSVET